jgi:hypothetical protein
LTANTAVEPTKIVPKPLSAEVPVAVKPVTLMFRLPSEEDKPENVLESGVEVATVHEVVVEEEPSLTDTHNNPYTIMFAIAVLGILYTFMRESENSEL